MAACLQNPSCAAPWPLFLVESQARCCGVADWGAATWPGLSQNSAAGWAARCWPQMGPTGMGTRLGTCLGTRLGTWVAAAGWAPAFKLQQGRGKETPWAGQPWACSVRRDGERTKKRKSELTNSFTNKNLPENKTNQLQNKLESKFNARK